MAAFLLPDTLQRFNTDMDDGCMKSSKRLRNLRRWKCRRLGDSDSFTWRISYYSERSVNQKCSNWRVLRFLIKACLATLTHLIWPRLTHAGQSIVEWLSENLCWIMRSQHWNLRWVRRSLYQKLRASKPISVSFLFWWCSMYMKNVFPQPSFFILIFVLV